MHFFIDTSKSCRILNKSKSYSSLEAIERPKSRRSKRFRKDRKNISKSLGTVGQNEYRKNMSKEDLIREPIFTSKEEKSLQKKYIQTMDIFEDFEDFKNCVNSEEKLQEITITIT